MWESHNQQHLHTDTNMMEITPDKADTTVKTAMEADHISTNDWANRMKTGTTPSEAMDTSDGFSTPSCKHVALAIPSPPKTNHQWMTSNQYAPLAGNQYPPLTLRMLGNTKGRHASPGKPPPSKCTKHKSHKLHPEIEAALQK
jgi:hypothetical protein